MSDRRRGLGRGLDSLIPGLSGEAEGSGVQLVDVDALEPNPLQPRASWDDAGLESLAQSIIEHGVIQPLIVTRGDAGTPYRIIAGERRWRAARRAGLNAVPVVVRDATSAQTLEIALVENLQRADLNPLEEALAYRQLADEFNLSQAEIARRVGKSRPAISNALRLLDLPEDARQAIVDGAITAGHARAILSVNAPERRALLLRHILERGLNVRQAEELARRLNEPASRPDRAQRPRSPEERSIEDQLRRSFGTQVDLKRNRSKRGSIVIHFYSDEELDGILQRLLPP
jgi:ParB family chromosome partitioning protein